MAFPWKKTYYYKCVYNATDYTEIWVRQRHPRLKIQAADTTTFTLVMLMLCLLLLPLIPASKEQEGQVAPAGATKWMEFTHLVTGWFSGWMQSWITAPWCLSWNPPPPTPLIHLAMAPVPPMRFCTSSIIFVSLLCSHLLWQGLPLHWGTGASKWSTVPTRGASQASSSLEELV